MQHKEWLLRDVVLAFILRLGLVYLLGRFVLPRLGLADYVGIQVLDSIIVIVLVGLMLQRRKSSLRKLFRKGPFRLSSLMVWGASAGFIMFFVGNWVEKWARFNLLTELSPHPLLELTLEADRAGEFLVPFLIGGFLVPLAEEVFYRGFLYPPLYHHSGALMGIILSGLLFGLVHFDQIWFLEIFAVGMVLTWLFHRFQSLWPGLIAHIILNSSRLIMIYLAV